MLKAKRDIQVKFDNTIGKTNNYSIPPIVYYEVKRGLTEKKAHKKLKDFNDLYNNCLQMEMTTAMWEKAIEIYVRLLSQGTPIGKDGRESDIFIAAFCIINGYTLITNNTKHYENIKELR
jgi:predicted nucleic acid-binding protein